MNLIQSSDAIFKCQMTYRGEDILTIGVSIPASYPDEPSLIILANGAEAFPAGDVTSIHAQELEMEVNCFWRELPREDGQTAASDEEGDSEKGRTFEEVFAKGVGIQPENLLTCQLARIASCLPIFLDSGDNTDGQIKKFCPQAGRFIVAQRGGSCSDPRLGLLDHQTAGLRKHPKMEACSRPSAAPM
ncbi:unnamed protein product [Mesocestoides corti]|uniref:Uncharacterized protein n=1 Tax=Mesocestoides corti TaxID=53468 RepID=A0A3P6GQV4_MESCO|nr:unnamed protein product [Mesocestoides corti]